MVGELRSLIEAEVEPVVAGLGFRLVELRCGQSRNQNHISITVYRPEGVSVDDCAAISRMLYPRLELIDQLDNLRLEVTSPGLDRVLKRTEEYEIFSGRGARVLTRSEGRWVGGTIQGVRGNRLCLLLRDSTVEVPLEDIQKVRLDDSEEVAE
jgi:ribosome maturation factor RimP